MSGGSVNLELTYSQAPAFKPLATLQQSSTRARCIRVQITPSGQYVTSAVSIESQSHFPAGMWWAAGEASPQFGDTTIGDTHGVLKIVYGSSNTRRVLYTDLASGDYALPPCDWCELHAAHYYAGDAPESVTERYDLAIDAEIIDGVAADFRPLTHTVRTAVMNNEASALFMVPNGAYACDLLGDVAINAELSGAAWAQRDFVNGASWPPSFPVPITRGQYIRATNKHSDPMSLGVIFFVR